MDGEAIYYGLNALSHNVIMADRKKLKNPNGLYLGVPGSGKSFAGKRELVNVFLATNDRIIILDPMGEYSPLVRQFGSDGLVVEIAPNSPHHINPMDLDVSVDDEVSPISLKCDFILSLMELIVGGKDGLQPVERTIIDRCARMVYRDFLNDPGHTPLPTLQDFYDLLCKQTETEAKRLATALKIYVSGSLNIFNHKTNVGYQDARVVCFDLKRLGAGLRTIAMHIINDLMNSQVSHNFARGLSTWCYYDEFHVLLQDELTSSYFVTIWKMLRKKGCVPSALTQNVKDLLASRQIENIFENSDFMVLLSQAQGDRQILAKQLGISPHQLSYVTHSNSGEGLLFFGNVTIPFVDRFPKNTKLYSIMTTRPEDRKAEAVTCQRDTGGYGLALFLSRGRRCFYRQTNRGAAGKAREAGAAPFFRGRSGRAVRGRHFGPGWPEAPGHREIQAGRGTGEVLFQAPPGGFPERDGGLKGGTGRRQSGRLPEEKGRYREGGL